MSSAYVSARVPARYERLVARQARAARTSKSDLVARYVIEKSLETEFPGISFRDSLSGREAYLTGHRVAVWEVVVVHEETKSADKTVRHFGWPRVLVNVDKHARPAEMAHRLVRGLGFLVHDDHFPHGDAMPGQVRLAPREGVAEGNSGELRLEALLDDVSRNEIALRGPS